MSVGMMMRSEYLKTRKRFAFNVTMLFFAGVTLISGIALWDSSRDLFAKTGKHNYALPDAWARILSDPAQMSVFFVAILIVLLISQEFPWRTARQNVIDGLSRNQWFLSKLLLMVGLCALFGLLVLTVGAAFALPGTAEGADWIRSVDLRMIGGYALALLGFASMAFFLSMLIRNPGPALGIFLLWFALAERVLDMLLTKFSDGKLAEVAEHFPAIAFMQLMETRNWDPEAMQKAMEAAARAGRPLQQFTQPNMELLVALAVTYIVAFIAISYFTYQKRDL